MAAPKGNKFALGNNGGRPPKYSSKKKLEEKINEYFESIQGVLDEKTGKHEGSEFPSVTGLALFLGFSDKTALRTYKGKEEFLPLIKRALTVIEHHYENRLNYQSPTGAIFALKNMGWKDRKEVDHTTNGETFNVSHKSISTSPLDEQSDKIE